MEINERVKEIIAEQLGVDPGLITPEAKLVEDLKVSCRGVLRLIVKLEDEFGIVAQPDAREITTVGEAISYIEAKIADK